MGAAPTRVTAGFTTSFATRNGADDGYLGDRGAIATTLLDLVRAIGEVTQDDREIVATVQHLLETGRVRLTGNFRDHPSEVFR